MVVDAVRTYLDAANGLTELSRKQAVAAAKTLLRASGPAAPVAGENESLPPRVGQSIQALAGELIETSQANREAITDLVRSEVERQLERMDVVPRAEHERLARRVAELERRLAARHAVERALVTTGTGASSPVRAVVPAASSAPAGAPADGSAPADEPAAAEEAASAEGSGAGDTPDTSADTGAGGGEAPARKGGTGSGGGPATAEKQTTAKSRPRTAAKNTPKTARTHSAAKRTTKGRGGTTKK
ncbi:accessory factor UbiK family protein [Nocardiopsis quinghaiensis]|uniref:accessory factor UbiK family protein n=1 Tax=Nocardiopsis quinghaiensis TaxID=464995 RepID=UPI00123AF98C|nr:accessory factor UbiK family protein [Nocardiopsis quinghaiensis]